jgi:hypothetical protein
MYFSQSVTAAAEHAALAWAAMLPEVGDVGGSAHDGEEMPLAGHTLELMSASLLELEP